MALNVLHPWWQHIAVFFRLARCLFFPWFFVLRKYENRAIPLLEGTHFPIYQKLRVAAWSPVHKMYNRKSVHCEISRFRHVWIIAFAWIWCRLHCVCFFKHFVVEMHFYIFFAQNTEASVPCSYFPTPARPASRNCDCFRHAAPWAQPNVA